MESVHVCLRACVCSCAHVHVHTWMCAGSRREKSRLTCAFRAAHDLILSLSSDRTSFSSLRILGPLRWLLFLVAHVLVASVHSGDTVLSCVQLLPGGRISFLFPAIAGFPVGRGGLMSPGNPCSFQMAETGWLKH